MVGAMRSFWKVFAALALMLPLGAFVAGNLVASAADDPTPRDTIIIDDTSGTPSSDPSPSSTPTGTPSTSPTHDQGDDQSDDHGGEGGGDDDGLDEVTPSPDDWDDHDDGHGGDDHGGDDNSGPGDRTTTPAPAGPAAAPGRVGRLRAGSAAAVGAAAAPGGVRRPATTVAATTTEQETTGARPERSGVSVRVRITAVVALLTFLALTGAGLIVYVIEAQRIDQDISDRVDQQFDEFQKFQEQEGASFATVGAMLDAFLEVEVPNDDKALVTWYDAGDGEGPAAGSPPDGYIGEDQDVFRDGRGRIAEDNGTTTHRRPEGRADPQRPDGASAATRPGR